MVTVREYDDDTEELWRLKRAFETGLGEGTGGDAKEAAYEAKLTDGYRAEYLSWVADCVAENPRCVQVAVEDGGLVGYVFVLPESLAYIWDSAVLNEVFVAEPYRGTGVADDLMEAALDAARDMDLPLDRIVLDVDSANERAREFYDRYGFSSWGELVARDL
ncbi:GNAT family N-acetyltransferase [Salarchaeum sp. JOR-1]|uniref:GNAT family N-acetyltransferase n=1 Tax=Salarchaeum sp. JOR-1 TaxID=2599399 RepID=UPI0011985036|nr:GNAT family N-acetyltransferase [Salarchaeum sp. JOR-1]QDX41747.1 GNAT family N-acetyltransferase [Salarchaeum sp. JOR-1]